MNRSCPGLVDTKDQATKPTEVFKMMRKRRKIFPECKAETVAMIREQGLSIREVSRDLDISDARKALAA